MKLVEIFDSIEGEGIRAGELSTFVRFAGCNLRCRYCDTKYAQRASEGTDVSRHHIAEAVRKIGNLNVTITGGEPLLQKELPTLLDSLTDFRINIETNGSVDITPFQRKNIIITMDYKLPSSGEESKMEKRNLSVLRECDVLKLVAEKSDFWRIEQLIKNELKSDCWIFLSPVFGKVEAHEFVALMKSMRTTCPVQKLRLQVQLHKVIWPVNMRGV